MTTDTGMRVSAPATPVKSQSISGAAVLMAYWPAIAQHQAETIADEIYREMIDARPQISQITDVPMKRKPPKMTRKQWQLYEMIAEEQARLGRPLTYREVAAVNPSAGLGSSFLMVKRMARMGWLKLRKSEMSRDKRAETVGTISIRRRLQD